MSTLRLHFRSTQDSHSPLRVSALSLFCFRAIQQVDASQSFTTASEQLRLLTDASRILPGHTVVRPGVNNGGDQHMPQKTADVSRKPSMRLQQ